ncbi:Elongation of very long chain fatty acids protein [Armadillidium nasatum]|uniref:Elongation of very long chain fatty acids protein n=1 Tax=Armadillidium nasatum TaxID=96803 RepID=A0A5N5T047_9CRUS|nr:Elongation of very long chain fatty acids protein [Armadillidium nasatum]
MASIVNMVVDSYHALFWDKRDKRVDGWLLMGSPFPTLFICLSYVYWVKVAGPRFMKNRDPFQFRNILVVYNALQVVFSAWIFYELGMSGWFGKYSYRCQPVDYSDDPTAVRMVHASWWYYFSKFTEFFDTIFFVLRKKFEHVSTLHVIHHGCMPMSVWFGVKFTPGGHSTFFGLLNSFVHIVMYFYYMMAAMGPQYAKYLWWKKYLTTLQMIQFVGIFTHAFQLCFIDCHYPRAFMWWIGGHAVLFFFLFSEFYRNAYSRRKEGKSLRSLDFSSIIPCMIQENGSKKNGYANGHIPNGNAKHSNGTSNGYANGHANGHVANGHANGYVKNTNGHVNGHLASEVQKEGVRRREPKHH